MNWNNYSEVKEILRVKLMPVEGNEELLKKIPHRLYEDIAMIYRMEIYASSSGDRVYTIFTNDDLTKYGITAKQLHEDAINAARSSTQTQIKSIAQIFNAPLESPGNDLYVVTTDETCGAWALFIPGAMRAYARSIACDGYYILPSSIHEMLLFPNKSLSAQELKQMVVEINATVVDPKDKLTDSVYYYDCGSDSFRKVA